MKDRIKAVRVAVGERIGAKYTQAMLADDLGLSKVSVTAFETGNRVPADSVLRLISEKFGVNYTWLLSGEGEMFGPKTREAEIADIAAALMAQEEESFRFQIVKLLAQMDDDQMEMLRDMVVKLYEGIKKEDP